MSRLLAYLWAPATVAAAIAVRMSLSGLVGGRFPYSTLILAVFCSALLGGTGPALLATLLGALAAVWFFVPPYHSLAVQGTDNLSGLVLYCIVCLVATAIVGTQRKAGRRAQAAAEIAEERRVQLELEVRDRERADASERLQRELLQVTLASIGDGVITADTEGRVTFLNPAAAGLTGWTAEEAAGRPVEEVFNVRNQETGAKVENPLMRAISEKRVIALANQSVLVSRSGRRTPVDDSGAPIKDAAGNVLGAVLVFRDVTQARAHEADLRARDRMIDLSHDAVIVADPARRITRWNTGARELYGWDEAEAAGKVLHDLLETVGPLAPAAIDDLLRREGRWDGNLTHTCKDGRVIVVETRQVLLRDAHGAITGLLEINRDITARLKAEETLRKVAAEAEEGRRTLEALMRHIPEGITIADAPDVRIRMVSRYGVGLTGRPRERLENLSASEQPAAWGLYHPDGVTPARPEELPLSRAVRQGEVTTDEEWALKRPDGTMVSILCNAGPVRDAQGHITGGVIAWRDITQRKRLEEKVREAARLESLGVLAGGIAHDFNNLLTGVLGNASLLLEDLKEGSHEWGFARSIASAADRAARLTQQMLAYSGRGRFVIEPVHLSQFISETTALIQSSIPKYVDLHLDLADDLPAVEADVAQMQQLVMNLVVNGGEAIGPEGGRLSIVTKAEHLDKAYIASLAAQDDVKPGLYVILEVHDTGRGMDENTVARIFDPFFTTKFTGRGLGLAAVDGIVRGHKGAINVYSTPGIGTTFRVLLPVREGAAAEAHPEAADDLAFEGEGTVLLVDDEEIVRATAKATLERLGYVVVLARHGQEAVHEFRARATEIALVILDMTMPGLSGEETLRQLRDIRADVPVILSSGFSEMEALSRFGGQRVEGFLQKPYTVRSLARKVRAAVAASA